jgi:cell division septation protein DedD
MDARAVVVGVVIAGGVVLASCSYTKAADSPVPAPTNAALVPTSRVSVVGTLPPITNAPTTVAQSVPVPVPAPGTTTVAPPATAAATTEPTVAPPPPSTTPRPPNTAPPATHSGGPVTVQAGAFSTRDAADQAVASLSGKGFGGFSVSGDGPFRVVRGGLSGPDGDALVRSLAAAGVAAFVRG